MKDQLKYLRSEIVVEPLIWNWHAWTHLVSPLTASGLLKNRYLKIMESFVKNPGLHLNALSNQKLMTGPYLNIEANQVEKISELIFSIKQGYDPLLKLSDDIRDFNKLLSEEMHGSSLENMYTRLPKSLQGCVELVYDLNHRPNIRFIEKLFYVKYNCEKAQSICFLSSTTKRSYILSTPRIENSDHLHIKKPFTYPLVKQLFAARDIPIQLPETFEELSSLMGSHVNLSNYFTDEAPVKMSDRNYAGESVRVRYFGHAAILIQSKTISILIDPFISTQSQIADAGLTINDLPDHIDYVLITHNHHDHVYIESLLQIKHKIGCMIVPAANNGFLADPSLKLVLTELGFDNVCEVRPYDNISLPDGEILSVPFLGEHGDLDISSKSAYLISLNNKSLLFVADSNNIDNAIYENLLHFTNSIDYLFIGMECVGAPYTWAYDHIVLQKPSRIDEQSRRLNGSHAKKVLQMIRTLNAKNIIIYAMGMEPWLQHVLGLAYDDDTIQIKESNALIEECKKYNINAMRPYGCHEWNL